MYDETINKQNLLPSPRSTRKTAVYVARHGTFHGRQSIKKTYANYFRH
jgi:hypothetical protein